MHLLNTSRSSLHLIGRDFFDFRRSAGLTRSSPVSFLPAFATRVRAGGVSRIIAVLLAFALGTRGMAAPTLSSGAGVSYTEGAAATTVTPAFSASGGGSYVNGSLQFSVGSGSSTETLALTTSSSASTTLGVASVVGNTVYLGNGTTADAIGTVDATANGQSGQPLKINFSTSAFANSSFEDGTTTGWDVSNARVIINGTNTIAGSIVPADSTPTPANGTRISPGDGATATMTFSNAIDTNVAAGGVNGTKSLSLALSGSVSEGGGVVRGPYAASASAFRLEAGNSVSFWWSAVAAGDAYDVFGYLLNVDTGAAQILVNATGSSGSATQAWTKVTASVSTAGNYKFVFISGSFDFSFGRALGARLLIDNVQIESGTSMNDSSVQAVGRLVTYRNTSTNPPASRTITISATNAASETSSVTQTINITAVNDAPTLAGFSPLTYTPQQTAAALSSNVTVADPDDTQLAGAQISVTANFSAGDTLGLVTNASTMGNVAANYDSTTGVLTLTGAATLAQYQAALRAITFATNSTSAATRTISYSVTDAAATGTGAQSGTGSTTVVITAPAPTITSAATVAGTYGNTFSYNITASSVIALSGYSATDLPEGLSVSTSTGAISGTPRVTGIFNVTIGASNAAATGTATLVLTIAKANLTVTGAFANTRVYDATTVATLNFSGASLVGIISPDRVTLHSSAATGAFESKGIGAGKPVSVRGLALAGEQATNYTFTTPTLNADITAKVLTVANVTANNKVYDATTVAALNLTTAALVGVAGTDAVSVVTTSGVGAFNNKTVGVAKPVSVSGLTLATGADAANYTLTQPATTATITAKNLTVTGATAASKVYDATVTATPTFTAAALAGIVGTDAVSLVGTSATATFADKRVGTGKVVSIAGLTLNGTDAENYSLTQPATTASITAKSVTVSGVTANSKTYDGGTSASLNLGSAALVGVVTGDVVTLSTTGATGTFLGANAGANKAITITGLALSGVDAGNYTLTQPGATATITPAAVSITISNLSHVYDGTPKQASVSASPTVSLSVVYPVAPAVNAGSYTVNASVTDSNYSGGASATLVIAKATQTITLTAPATATLATAATVGATASSGLPVTLAVSGPATLSGSQLTFSAPGSATLTATQAGNINYQSATATATITAAGKLAQTIAFGAPGDRLSSSGSFPLNATATSGLPVSFTIVGGPALLSGNTVTLTGTAGSVLVRASQAGNAIYNPAPDVNVSFSVTAATLNVFFGALTTSSSTTKSGDVAATLPPNSNKGSLLVVAPNLGVNTVLDFTLNPDGTFTQTVIIDAPGGGVSASDTPARAAAPITCTIRGTIINGRLSGTIEPLGLAFSANVLSVTGSSANAAGFYKSSTLANTHGATYTVVGTNNEVLVLAKTADVTTGGLTTLSASGTFTLTTATSAGMATVRGSVDEPTTTVAGTISLPGKLDTSFAGLVVTTVRTDRLVNLSSRVRISAADPVLITGFVIGGNEPKQVLVRGIGPALSGFGLQGVLANPRIRIYRGSEIIAENDNWSTAANAGTLPALFSRLGAFALANNSADAALVVTLPPGAYTAQVFDGGGTGVVLAEIYDASMNPNSDYQRLVNISTRGEAGTGENILIGGFVVTGNSPKKLLVRGIGPSLAAFGVGGTLADPRLRVFSGPTVLAENDNWSTGTVAEVAVLVEAMRNTGAFTLANGSRDAALILTLAPGSYTAQVAAANGTATGVALVEIYEVPE